MSDQEIALGWTLYKYCLFKKQLIDLTQDVKGLKSTHPDTYKNHPKTKLLASVLNSIRERVPSNPEHADFRQGNTLGKDKRHWRRVKKGIPSRYRLFFRFKSVPPAIVYAWINDEKTLRKAGAKTDCYETFKKMLKRGEVPDDMKQLIAGSD